MRKILIILIVSLIILGCQDKEEFKQPDIKQDVNLNYQGYTLKDHRMFSVMMPIAWTETEYQNIFFYLPNSSEIANPLSEKVQIISVMLPADNKRTLKQILNDGMNESRVIVPDLAKISEESIVIDGKEGIKMTFNGTLMGKTFENTQVSVIYNNVLTHIIHNCFIDNCNNKEIYDAMVDSLELRTRN